MGIAQTPEGNEAALGRWAAAVERGTIVRCVIILGLLLFALFGLPSFVGADWITTLTSVAIYSVVAAGFGLLYGRVGMISLGQVALLSIGCWVGTRLSYATDLPFPVLILLVGAITCAVGVLVGLPALRLSGLYLALITLMFAGATTIVLSVDRLPERRRWVHGPDGSRRPVGHAPGPEAGACGGRHGVLPVRRRRLRTHVRARARARRRKARASVGCDP